MANGKGVGNSNGWQQHDRDGGSNGWRRPQWQWPMATAMVMSDCNGNGNGNGDGNGVSNGNGDGDGDGNGDGHGEGGHYKGRVASSCGGDVQPFWRGDTLPPPPWTQRKVHSPMLHHGGDTAKSVCSPSRGRVPGSSPWIFFCLFFTTTVQFTEQPSFNPPVFLVEKSIRNSAEFRNLSDSGPFELRNFHPNFIFPIRKCVPANSEHVFSCSESSPAINSSNFMNRKTFLPWHNFVPNLHLLTLIACFPLSVSRCRFIFC
jgi:hypothetical protein